MQELLQMYNSGNLTSLASNTFGELKRVGFNAHSGKVWLEDEDYNCLMVNGDKLDLYISTPYSGLEGFLADILNEYDLDDLHGEDKEYLEEAIIRKIWGVKLMPGEYTNKVLELVDDELLSWEQVAIACLKYMSEDDVKDMAESNEFVEAIKCGQLQRLHPKEY